MAGLPPEAQPQRTQPLERFRWILRAWRALEGDRPWIGGGMSAPMPGRLPFVAVHTWGRHCGYGAERIEFLAAVLAALDAELIAWHSRQAKLEAMRRGNGS